MPKGTVVAWSCYVLHRKREYYGDDADEFRPERWETLRPSWEYLPFNGGPRICVGREFFFFFSCSPFLLVLLLLVTTAPLWLLLGPPFSLGWQLTSVRAQNNTP